LNTTLMCKHCQSLRVQKRGKTKKGKTKIQCKDCGKYSRISGDFPSPRQIKSIAARILLFDIETAPMEVYVWGLKYNNYISPESIIKDYSILCWSAKWLFEPEIISAKVTGEMAVNREDKSILQKMWELLDEADVVVVQNGKKFDIPKLNSRFLLAGFPPPMYYQVVDTKEVMTKNFGFSSNKLDYVNKLAGLDRKDDMEYQDWIDCVHGDEKALEKMNHYNKDDVVIMEELYLWLRPWIPSHANLGIYADMDQDCCPNCQSTELKWSGQYATPLSLYDGFRCMSCGAIGRSTRKEHKINGVKVRG
jgi:RNase P subunit RPR2